MNIKNFLPKFFLFLILLAFGCSSDQSKTQQQTVSPESNSVPAITSTNYYINSVSNEAIAEIIDGKEVTLRLTDLDLFGELKGDKRKYYDQNNQFRYAVKYKQGDSFKVRDENEALLWKVKLMEDKIKIASNEEMEDAYQIRITDGKKIKIKKLEEEVGAMRFISSDQSIRVKDKYLAINFSASHALGILMIDEIPEIEKYLICAELLKLKR